MNFKSRRGVCSLTNREDKQTAYCGGRSALTFMVLTWTWTHYGVLVYLFKTLQWISVGTVMNGMTILENG